MASGDTLLILTPQMSAPPAASYATLATGTGTSTPAESIPVLNFDDGNQEYIDFYCVMPSHYAGTTGVTLTVVFSAAETASDVVAWQAAFRRLADDAEQYSSSHTYAYNEVIATAPSATAEVAYDDITFTNGADMDSVVAGDYFILRVTRDPTPSSGTDVTGDASLHAVHVKET